MLVALAELSWGKLPAWRARGTRGTRGELFSSWCSSRASWQQKNKTN